jgi:hypothetical protein
VRYLKVTPEHGTMVPVWFRSGVCNQGAKRAMKMACVGWIEVE